MFEMGFMRLAAFLFINRKWLCVAVFLEFEGIGRKELILLNGCSDF